MSYKFNCPWCGSESKTNKISDFKSNWGDYSIELVGVPLIECADCQEIFLTSGSTRLVQKIAKIFSENVKLRRITRLNISEILLIIKTVEEQDKFIDSLTNNVISPKKIHKEYRITRTDALQALSDEEIPFDFGLAARNGEINLSDLEVIKNDIEEDQDLE